MVTVLNIKDELPNISEDVMKLNPELFGIKLDNLKYKHIVDYDIKKDEVVFKKNKYNVSPKEDRTYNGITYASKKECKYAKKLDDMIERGEIDFYLRQVPFDLGAGITYRADFVTFKTFWDGHNGGWIIKVIEPKGFKTPEWKLKLKLFKEKYPNLTLEIV
jgi:hypothetical protein